MLPRSACVLLFWALCACFAAGGYALSENFEQGLGSFVNTGSLNWTVGVGSTPTFATGPNTGHSNNNGSDAGKYVFMESSSPNSPYRGPFILEAPLISGAGEVSFWYSMNGAGCGSISMGVFDAGSSSWKTWWEKSGEQGVDWQMASTVVQNGDASRLRFSGTTGPDETGDIALDDVRITAAVTAMPTSIPAPSMTPSPTYPPTPMPSASPTSLSVLSEAQLQAAITQGVSSIQVANDILLARTITLMGANVSIDGQGFSLNGQGRVRCVYLTDASVLHLTDLTITGGLASSGGGGIMVAGDARLILINCQVVNNTAISENESYGGGIFIYSASAEISRSVISFNKSTKYGGGILVLNGHCSLEDCTVADNQAHYGGGLQVYLGTMIASDCVFKKNIASRSGGGFYFDYCKVMIIRCNMSSNEARGGDGGGGVYALGRSNITIGASVLVNNTAFDSAGGGMYLSIESRAVLFDTHVVGNRALGSPAFLSASSTFGACEHDNNCFYSPQFPSTYSNYEECEFIVGENDVLLQTVTFETESRFDVLNVGDVSPYSGTKGPSDIVVSSGTPIIFTSDGSITAPGFKICQVTSGGGIYASSQSSVSLTRTLVAGNEAAFRGGGIALLNSAVLECEKGDISGNVAGTEGGGIYISSSSANLNSTSLLRNSIGSESTVSSEAVYLDYGVLESTDLKVDGNFAGTFASSSATCGSSCAAGEFGACSIVTGAPNCFANCDSACNKCPLGHFSAALGATSQETCQLCGAGQAASEIGSTICSSCQAGRYAANSSMDVGGGQKDQVVSGATSCNRCPSGFISTTPSAIVCQECPEGSDSSMGASVCDLAAKGYYLDPGSGKSKPCPENARCTGGSGLPRPLPGFWVERRSLQFVHEIYRCARMDVCGGAKRGSNHSKCWQLGGYGRSPADNECDDQDALLCNGLSAGPLCGACVEGSAYSPTLLTCQSCEEAGALAAVTAMCLAAATLVAVALYFGWVNVSRTWGGHVVRVLRQIDSGMARVVLSTYQIVGSIAWSLDITWPEPMASWDIFLSFLSFDFFAVRCYTKTYFTGALVRSAVPIAIEGCIFTSYLVTKARRLSSTAEAATDDGGDDQQLASQRHASVGLLVTFLVLPPIMRTQFQSMDCVDIAGGSYLRVDTSVDCGSEAFRRFAIANGLFMAAYLSVPLAWAVLLWRRRGDLLSALGHARAGGRRPDMHRDASYQFRSLPSLQPLKFLFQPYRAAIFYWEPIEMCVCTSREVPCA